MSLVYVLLACFFFGWGTGIVISSIYYNRICKELHDRHRETITGQSRISADLLEKAIRLAQSNIDNMALNHELMDELAQFKIKKDKPGD